MRRGSGLFFLVSFLLCVSLVSGLLLAEAQTPALADGKQMELRYAENYRVKIYPDGAALLTIGEKENYLLLPAEAEVPEGMENLARIPIPAENIYLASSSAADLFLQAGALSSVRYSGTSAENWKVPELQSALREEEILYAGKYSAPDYELLLTEGCGLAVENTMILHSPATKEKLESLGIPVLVEYSSYEPHPLGRVEWIKLYGLLSGRLEEAKAFFERQEEIFRSAEASEPTGKTVAFFHITPAGAVVVRRQADYVTQMIEIAGGKAAVADLPEEENALSTVTIQIESFYAQALNADVLIYNSTTAGDVESMEQFLALSPLLKDFKAVQDGNVWCTEMSMFQKSSAAAEMIADFRAVLTGSAGDTSLNYLHRID
jgi:iron complex transport system substrate-binding protein